LSKTAISKGVTAQNGLNLAAHVVSSIYDAINRPDLSGMIRNGEADDFPEIKATAALLAEEKSRLDRYEVALSQYADPGFWDEAGPGGALAQYDSGEMARNVLAGRAAFYHRD
jgi:hypothetical protein